MSLFDALLVMLCSAVGFTLQGARVRGTLSSLFLIGTIISLAALSLVGRFGREELRLTLALLPGALFGFVSAGSTASRPAAGIVPAMRPATAQRRPPRSIA